jgi:hypothetical protein
MSPDSFACRRTAKIVLPLFSINPGLAVKTSCRQSFCLFGQPDYGNVLYCFTDTVFMGKRFFFAIQSC